MQKRFTIALVSTALFSIVLVGFGVLAIAQVGARSRAEDQVTRSLNVVSDLLVAGERSDRQIESLLFGSRRNLGLDYVEPVLIDDDGNLRLVNDAGRRRGLQAAAPPGFTLDTEQLEALDGEENVLVSADGGVFGVRLLATPEIDGRPPIRVAMLAGQQVSAVSGQTVAWFTLSSAIVLAGATAAGLLLARRLTGPITEIQDTTSAIAGGDLSARVETSGSDEVAQLGQAVNKMAADLQRSKALDRQFLMSISHDLKTPLTAIAGYAEGLSDGAVTDPKAAGDVIASHATRLERLVGDLLDLARLDANRFRLNIRSFDLSVVAGRTMAGVLGQADRHGIELTRSGSDSMLVSADSDRTAQAIGNLIDNAIKFADSRVVVEVVAENGFGIVSVSDDGPGIPDADLEHVFDRLYTGTAQPERAENPTGLGLAIVRELTNAMGGRVTAGNNPDGGARLSLSLPLGGPASVPEPSTGSESASPTPPDHEGQRASSGSSTTSAS